MVEYIIELRRRLHRAAERSGREEETARILREELQKREPEEIVDSLGGHGIAAIFEGDAKGPTLLARSDMDALPLSDDPELEYRAERAGTAHLCGHDGHMATLVGLADHLAERRPARGRVVLLFQPAEETGAGAYEVLEDPNFAPLRPDIAVAMHNLPGYPLGSVILRRGVFASASRGMIVELKGRSSHAAEPHLGRSPVEVASSLAQRLGTIPQSATALHEAAQVTVVGMELGGPAFGTTPGQGRVMATLRAHQQEVMDRIADRAADLARSLAAVDGLECAVSWTEEFPSTVNDGEAVERIAAAAEAIDLPVVRPEYPFAWSEDFGHFTARGRGALFGLGSGERQPALHAGGYDYPDALLGPGRALWIRIVEEFLGAESGE